MANSTLEPRPRVRAKALLSLVAVGAITASFGLVVPAAYADEAYPSWEDVQKAKQNEATTAREVENISALLVGLQDSATEAVTDSLIAAEAYHITRDELDAATARQSSLRAQARQARAIAETSKLRAGLIAAHLAKTGAQSLSVNLFLNGDTADDLLHRLGTANKLSEQSDTIYRQALQDTNAAKSLTDQAESAEVERARLADESKALFDAAAAASQLTQKTLEAEQRKSTELFEQLAVLKDSTAEVERSFASGRIAAAEAAAVTKAQAAAAKVAAAAKKPASSKPASSKPASSKPAASKPATSKPAAGKPATSKPTAANPAPATPTTKPAPAKPAPSAPAPTKPTVGNPAPVVVKPTPPVAPAPAAPAPAAPVVTPAPAPNVSAVNTALVFARAQLGDRYEFGGSGPDAWDCSGLTKAAYASAGIYIGTHSATNQYNTMARQGRLVSFAQVQVGDLVFWGKPGNYYHVAIYVGGGRIIEAPNPTQPVRIGAIWSPGAVAPYVGRPS